MMVYMKVRMKNEALLFACYAVSVLCLAGYSFWVSKLILEQQILGDYSHYLWEYADHLLQAVTALLLVCAFYAALMRIPKLRRPVTAIFAALLVLCSLYASFEIVGRYELDTAVKYRNSERDLETRSSHEIIWEIWRACSFAAPAELHEMDMAGGVEALFGSSEGGSPLALVSMLHGYGLALVYVLLVLTCSVCMVSEAVRIRGWQLAVYVICTVPPVLLLYGPVFDALGLLRCPYVLFDRVPCRAQWYELFVGGLLQMAAVGWFLLRSSLGKDAYVLV